MVKKTGELLRIFFFWYLLFNAGRLVFIILNHKLASPFGPADLLSAFWFAIRLDASMSCYLCIVPLLLWFTGFWVKDERWINRIHRMYTLVLSIAVLLVINADAVLYQFWEQKLNAYASSFAKFPKEMLVFSSGASSWLLLLMVVLEVLLTVWLFRKLLPRLKHPAEPIAVYKSLPAFVLLTGLVFLGIRGGVGKSVINQSAAYYSDKPFLNHVAVNPSWNFLSTLVQPLEESNRNPYAFTDEQEAETRVNELLHTDSIAHVRITQHKQPNIIFIVLEGWTADVIEAIGGEPGVTPNLNAWSRQGYLFDHFYANGNRTDKGLAAIFSSQPALAHSSIINHIEKFSQLPSLARSFSDRGYRTVFHYGGDAIFANMKAYWLSAGFSRIRDLATFPLSDQNAEWGVHDDKLFPKVLQELSETAEPFFAGVLTLSSHEPFKVPMSSRFNGDAPPDQYRNSVYFADSCLGAFLRNARQQSWYQNTLFIILADHGHQWPKDRPASVPERFHIPLLITGGALDPALKGSVNHRRACQVDLAKTLLVQLGMPASGFRWSRNMADTTARQFATYVFNDGIGYVDPQRSFVFDQESKQLIDKRGDADTALLQRSVYDARAYEQVYFSEYLKR